MPAKKIKITDAAKDLTITAADIAAALLVFDENDKRKPSASIEVEDMDRILNYFTEKNSVENFDAFFADNKKPDKTAEQKAEEEQKQKAKEKRPLPKIIPKAGTGIAKTVKDAAKSIVKSGDKGAAAQNSVKPGKEEPKEQREPRKTFAFNSRANNKAEEMDVIQPRSSAAKAELENKNFQMNSKKTVGGYEVNERGGKVISIKSGKTETKNIPPEQPQNNKSVKNNKNFQQNYQNRNNQVKRQQNPLPYQLSPTATIKTSQSEKFAKRVTETQKAEAQKVLPKDKKDNVKTPHTERQKLDTGKIAEVTAVEKKRHTVDTRGTYVELDKYNERYDQIANTANSPVSKKDAFVKKQKINSKSQQRAKQQFSNKRETEAQKMRRLELERARKQQLRVLIPDEIVISELAARLKVNVAEVIKKTFKLGIMAAASDVIDFDTASLVADELGAKVEKEVIVTIEERLFDEDAEDMGELEPRDPVVVVMGHVDHGKTSLLDKIRNANVVAGEAGGITQHIGAYRVKINERKITFLDTPGHEAFTSMRARGAQVTDIAVLVVAADDGIMPQTIEAINHAKAAGVAIIVAVNKIDKDGANPDKVKQELTEHGLVIEAWGGDVVCCEVSAKTGDGIDDLLENIAITADVLELKAAPNRKAKGAIIEARLDKGRGPVATLLVQNGTLNQGDVIIAGMAVGKVRVMTNDKGRTVKTAGPSVPVEITGLAEVPAAGDTFNCVADEKLARELVEKRKHEAKQERFSQVQKVTLDNIFSQIADGAVKELPLIVKADVQGSVEAVRQSLEKISNEEVRVRVIHGGVGAIRESDVMLADASNAIIIGFNVRPDPIASESAARASVDIRTYRVIYDAIEEIEDAIKGMLAPKFKETILGRVEVRKVIKIPSIGAVAGSYVLSGKVTRNCQIRVVRDGIVIAEDEMSSLQRFKDSVKEVATGYECGITLEKFSDIKEHDIFEAFIIEEIKQ